MTAPDRKSESDRPTRGLLIDAAMADFDMSIAEHLIVRADPAAVFGAVWAPGFLSIHNPSARTAMWARGMSARADARRALERMMPRHRTIRPRCVIARD